MASHFCPLKWNYQEISVFFKTYESSDAISSSSSSSCIVHTGEPVVVLLFHLASQESWMALSVHEIRISKIDGLTHSIFTFKGRSSFHQPSELCYFLKRTRKQLFSLAKTDLFCFVTTCCYWGVF